MMMGGSYSVDRIRKSMVKILGHNETQVAGSGFIIKADAHSAHLITCHHVIFPLENQREFFVELDIGVGDLYDAEILIGWRF